MVMHITYHVVKPLADEVPRRKAASRQPPLWLAPAPAAMTRVPWGADLSGVVG